MHQVIWITGQPGSGKTTLAMKLAEWFDDAVVVDGDDLRKIMPNPGYDRGGRTTNIDRAQAIAAWEQERGKRVIVALVSPYNLQRERFKVFRPVFEVYLTCSEERGREEYFVNDYEEPESPNVQYDTAKISIEDEVRDVLGAISATSSRA